MFQNKFQSRLSNISPNKFMYTMSILFVLFYFIWYYITLPESVLLPHKKNKKPTIFRSFVSYLIYILPGIIFINFVSSKDIDCKLINSYVNTICKK